MTKKKIVTTKRGYNEALDLFLNLARPNISMFTNYEDENYKGVQFVAPENTWIDTRVEIGAGTIIFPGCVIMGKTRIGKNCIIFPYTTLLNCQIGDYCLIGVPAMKNSRIGAQSIIGANAELSRSKLSRNVKMLHHSYLGDTTVGPHTNIAAGAITANYGGREKRTTKIAAKTFIGVNANLIAPITIETEAYIGAGAIVRKNVAPHSVVVGLVKVLPDRISRYTENNWEIIDTTKTQ